MGGVRERDEEGAEEHAEREQIDPGPLVSWT
jgi:hypothetical protein